MSAENFVPGPYFGDFGGRFVAESLMGPLEEVEAAWKRLWRDKSFQARLRDLFANYAGRPSLLTEAPRFAADLGGVRVFLKREDLNHTGSHKINNVLGQALLTKELGKTRVIAETGAGQHGVATATAAALLGLDCTIYMGREDTERQALNVARMQMLGAEVIAVTAGSATLKDAINEAFRDWVTNVETTNYIFGTAAGPHPFPELVRDLQRVIGDEARAQLLATEGRLPDVVVACVGGGSNAIGSFTAFIDDPSVELLGCEAAGDGFDTGRHAASITADQVGVLHGARTFVLQERDGQTKASHSISAGLVYPRLRRRGHGRLPAPVTHGGHHSRDRVIARARRGARVGPRERRGRGTFRARRRAHRHRDSVGARRQGRGHGVALVRIRPREATGHRPERRPLGRGRPGRERGEVT